MAFGIKIIRKNREIDELIKETNRTNLQQRLEEIKRAIGDDKALYETIEKMLHKEHST